VSAALLTVRDVCRETTLSRSSIWRQVKGGTFPRPVQLSPNRIAFRVEDVNRWVESRGKLERSGGMGGNATPASCSPATHPSTPAGPLPSTARSVTAGSR
jgi:prophage regulatory protein